MERIRRLAGGCGGSCRPATSELEALRAEPGFSGVTLRAPLERILADLPGLGTAVATTANMVAVISRIGCYAPPQRAGEPLLLDSKLSSLRFHKNAVGLSLAVDRLPASRLPPSLRLFGTDGACLHKCFLTDCRNDLAFAAVADDWCRLAPDNTGRPADAGRSPSALAMTFDDVLGDGGIARRLSLGSRDGTLAWRVSPSLLSEVLTRMSEIRVPLALAIGNAGVSQIHYGAIERLRHSGSLTLADGDSVTVSLDHSHIEEIWVTACEVDGAASYVLEVYDWGYQCVLQLAVPDGHYPGLRRYWEQILLSLPI